MDSRRFRANVAESGWQNSSHSIVVARSRIIALGREDTDSTRRNSSKLPTRDKAYSPWKSNSTHSPAKCEEKLASAAQSRVFWAKWKKNRETYQTDADAVTLLLNDNMLKKMANT
jgi:hypothetical protein